VRYLSLFICFIFELDNQYGQLGRGHHDTQNENNFIPQRIPDLWPVIQISCGANHSVCLDAQNQCWCWGDQSLKQLPLGSESGTIVSTPTKGIRLGSGTLDDLESDSTTVSWKVILPNIYMYKSDRKVLRQIFESLLKRSSFLASPLQIDAARLVVVEHIDFSKDRKYWSEIKEEYDKFSQELLPQTQTQLHKARQELQQISARNKLESLKQKLESYKLFQQQLNTFREIQQGSDSRRLLCTTLENWTCEDVCAFLRVSGLKDLVKIAFDNRLNGCSVFYLLAKPDLLDRIFSQLPLQIHHAKLFHYHGSLYAAGMSRKDILKHSATCKLCKLSPLEAADWLETLQVEFNRNIVITKNITGPVLMLLTEVELQSTLQLVRWGEVFHVFNAILNYECSFRSMIVNKDL
jgi:hypothetical protein